MSGVRCAGLKLLSLLILLGLTGCLPPPTSYVPAIINLAVPSAIPLGGTAPVSVTVNYTGGGLLTYSWDDGNCSGSFSPNNSSSASNSVYTAPTTTGTCTITIKVITRSGRYASASAVTTIVPLQVTEMIGPEGGKLTLSNGINASIPPNFFVETTEVTLSAHDSPLVPFLPNTQTITPSVRISFDTTHLTIPTPESDPLVITIPVSLITDIPMAAGTRAVALQTESVSQRIIRWVQKTADRTTELIGHFVEQGNQVLVRIPPELLWGTGVRNTFQEVTGLDISDCFGRELEQPKLFKLIGSSWEEVPNIETSKKPLLLIHGFQPLQELCIRRGDPLTQTTNDWKEFVEFFNDHSELGGQYDVFSYVYNTNHPMARIVDQFKQKIGTHGSLVILAHSMGGIVARSFMLEVGGEAQVEKLITLGTPHHGTPLANYESGFQHFLFEFAWCLWTPLDAVLMRGVDADKLRWDSFNGDARFPPNHWLLNLNASNPYHEAKIRAYEGRLSTEQSEQDFKGKCLNALGYDPNDTVVPMDSALYTNHLSYNQVRTFQNYDHNEIRSGKGDDTLFRAICRDLGGCNGPALITNFQASDNEDSQSTLTWTNPSDSDLAQIVVKRKTTGYPANHDDGETRLTIDSATPSRAETFVDTGLTNGTVYYYSVFSRNQAGNWNDQVVEGKNADIGRPQVLPPPPPPLTAPWPMFQHDAQRTGRSPATGPQNSNIRWTFQEANPFWEPTIARDGTIYVGAGWAGSAGGLYAISRDGALKWFNNTVRVFTSPLVGSKGDIFVVDNGRALVAMNSQDGSEKWRYQFGVQHYDMEIAADDNNGNIYLVTGCWSQDEQSWHPKLFTFSPQGSIIWVYDAITRQTHSDSPCPGNMIGGTSSLALDSNGSIYFGVTDPSIRPTLVALQPDGTERWQRTFDREIVGISIHPDGTLYVSVHDVLYALDPDNPNQDKWAAYVQGLESPVTIGPDGDLYVTGGRWDIGWQSYLYAFDSQGNAKWTKFISS
ncbi:MAG: PQQ-binding-like beta-propeller repeat protein, partial [Candidatus Hadarchaeum sp.]